MPGAPRKSHASSETTNLDAKRASLASDIIGQIPECPLEHVFQSLLPPPSPSVPSLQSLKEKIGAGSDWAQTYNFTKPKISLFEEDETFEKLSVLFNDVNQACNCNRPSVLRMVNTPSKAPRVELGSKRAHATRPDACLALVESKSVLTDITMDAPPWSDIAIIWEYKKRDNSTSIKDNATKILWNMSQIMALDPCRRFTYGLTIENTGLRVWFCDRCGYIVSEPIAYLDSDHMLEIFARLSSASQADLGYDPSINRAYRNETTQYEIQLDTRVFKTKRLLANHNADLAVGRATRVWEVYEGDDDTRTHALKDVWVEESRLREGDIYTAILEDASEEERRYFLTVLYHGDVKLPSGQVDTTLGIRRSIPPADTFDVMSQLARSFSHSSILEGSVGGPGPSPRGVGVPLSALRNLETIWETVCDANMGLVVMQKRGWIHRDISAFNILVCGQAGKLSDLEFAMPYNSNADPNDSHAPLAGTKDFMSAELFAHDYLYWAYPPFRKAQDYHARTKETRVFLQNFFHDAESLWWVVLWALTRLDPADRVLDKPALGPRRKQYRKWFPSSPRQTSNAFDILLSKRDFVDPLYSSEMPQEYEPIVAILVAWRDVVVERVSLAEPASGIFTPSAMDELHLSVQNVIRSSENLAHAQGIGELKLLDGFF